MSKSKAAAKESSNSKKLSIQVIILYKTEFLIIQFFTQKVGICKRMVKEVSSYEKEVIQNEAKVQKMRDENKDEYGLIVDTFLVLIILMIMVFAYMALYNRYSEAGRSFTRKLYDDSG